MYILNGCTIHFASLVFIECKTELFSFMLLSILRVHYFSFIQTIQLKFFLYEVIDIYFESSQHISVLKPALPEAVWEKVKEVCHNMQSWIKCAKTLKHVVKKTKNWTAFLIINVFFLFELKLFEIYKILIVVL